ncbi:MAG: aminotransferase class V-fold PLP-dependent enzyme, partial [Thermoanaerobaculia bacterium]|nr:aminotransferase class V-fold PLP-dependent enzyme [Thermoanaerobaculia bacterium]
LEVEAAGVDIATGAAHKWLLGPEGIGLLYVSDRVVERLRPVLTGWRSVRGLYDWTALDLTWNEGALRFEPGTLNVYGLAALERSLEMLLEVGPRRIENRILELADRVAGSLSDRGWRVLSSRVPGEKSGIVSAVHPSRKAEEVAESLAEEGVIVAHRAGRIRISPHFYNTEDEVERLLSLL